MKNYLRLVLFALLLAGCAGPATVVNVSPGPGKEVVDITASNFDFQPQVIRVQQGRPLILSVQNVSGMEHNITVKNPDGEIIASQDLAAHETIRMEVPLSKPGEYPFYCNKFMHTPLGMRGRLEVEK